MDSSRKASLPRQISFRRGRSLQASMVGFARSKKLLCIATFFVVGTFFGYFITWMASTSNVSARSALNSIPRPLTRASVLIQNSRKKDMSVQFRDYIPRFLFINCGGTYPKSVELFIDTYPDSSKYSIFSFIPDASYAPLYTGFPSHTVISPALCAAANGTATMHLQSISGKYRTASVPKVDIAQWILSNTHADEHIVLKVDVPDEIQKDIAKRLAETSAIEWINTFYTASDDVEVRRTYEDAFRARGQGVESWNELKGMYGQFTLKPTGKRIARKSVIKKCGDSKRQLRPLFLYASEENSALNKTLRLLKTFSDNAVTTRLPVAIFLPLTFIKAHRLELKSIFSRFDGGVYFNVSVARAGSNKPGTAYSSIRTQFIGTEHDLRSQGLVLQYVLAGKAVPLRIAETLVQERHYHVFVNMIEVEPDRKHKDLVQIPQTPDDAIPVMDISRPGSSVRVLLLLERQEKRILPLVDCLAYISS